MPWRPRLRTWAREEWPTLLGVAGGAAVTYGFVQVWSPLAWIAAGSGAVLVAWRVGRTEEPKR